MGVGGQGASLVWLGLTDAVNPEFLGNTGKNPFAPAQAVHNCPGGF